ncbi:MAG: GIY-YIG nuclease family protein [Symploca sp. SIO2G7]|nr:GIY-YIG nuclease family protein [Symploca sp. SIO2G7]
MVRECSHPKRWASVELEERSRLPHRSGVYAVINHRKIYYIGFSSNLNQRWRGKGHHRFAQADRLKQPRLHYLLLPKTQARTLEKTLISRYRPLWNYSKVPVVRQVCWWRNLLIAAACLVVVFVLYRSLVLGLAAAIVAIALFYDSP